MIDSAFYRIDINSYSSKIILIHNFYIPVYFMQNEPHCPHDKLFKNLMTDRLIAEEFFKNNLPLHIRTLIDFNSLTLCSGSYVEMILKTKH